MDIDWPHLLGDQLGPFWERVARPRLNGLSDEEYFGEPVPDCWSLRPQRDADGQAVGGLVMEREELDSGPEPFTTISWRLAHVIRDIFGRRTHRLFDGPVPDRTPFAETAIGALGQLDDAYRRWQEGISGLTMSRLAEPCTFDHPYFDGQPLAALILHVNREVLWHCAEIALLRDLYVRIPPALPIAIVELRRFRDVG